MDNSGINHHPVPDLETLEEVTDARSGYLKPKILTLPLQKAKTLTTTTLPRIVKTTSLSQKTVNLSPKMVTMPVQNFGAQLVTSKPEISPVKKSPKIQVIKASQLQQLIDSGKKVQVIRMGKRKQSEMASDTTSVITNSAPKQPKVIKLTRAQLESLRAGTSDSSGSIRLERAQLGAIKQLKEAGGRLE